MKRTPHRLPIYCAIVFQIILCAFIAGCGPRKVSYGTAVKYTNMEFTGDPNVFRAFYTGFKANQFRIAPVWMRLKDGETIELSSISEGRVRSWDYQVRNGTDSPGSHTLPGSNPEERMYGVDLGTGGATFTFIDGRLSSCCIRESYQTPLEGVQVGPSKAGEFLSFPIRREDLIRVFGKPNSVGEIWAKAPPI